MPVIRRYPTSIMSGGRVSGNLQIDGDLTVTNDIIPSVGAIVEGEVTFNTTAGHIHDGTGSRVLPHYTLTTGTHGVGIGNIEGTLNKNIASGYAGLDANADVPAAQLDGTHGNLTSDTHGMGASIFVGTALIQTLTNKTMGLGNSISEDIPVAANKKIDSVDIDTWAIGVDGVIVG